MGGEEQAVAGEAVFRPFAVDPEILDRRLDLDDPEVAATGSSADHVGAPAGGERQLADDGEAAGAQQPADAALDGGGALRLPPVDGRDDGFKRREHPVNVARVRGRMEADPCGPRHQRLRRAPSSALPVEAPAVVEP